jgi:hypothetical protein
VAPPLIVPVGVGRTVTVVFPVAEQFVTFVAVTVYVVVAVGVTLMLAFAPDSELAATGRPAVAPEGFAVHE